MASVTSYERYGWNDVAANDRASCFIEYSAVPVAGSLPLFALGLAALLQLRRRPND